MYLWNWVFHGVMFGWGGKIWSDDFKTSLVNSKENLDCFKWFIDARKQGLYPEAGAMPQGVNPFGGGLVPMAFQGSWATVALRDVIKDKFDFDVVAMPKSPTGAPCLNAAGGAWGIAKNSKAVEAAWTFNKFLTNTDSNHRPDLRPAAQHPRPQIRGAALERDRGEGRHAAQERRRLRQADAGSRGRAISALLAGLRHRLEQHDRAAAQRPVGRRSGEGAGRLRR